MTHRMDVGKKALTGGKYDPDDKDSNGLVTYELEKYPSTYPHWEWQNKRAYFQKGQLGSGYNTAIPENIISHLKDKIDIVYYRKYGFYRKRGNKWYFSEDGGKVTFPDGVTINFNNNDRWNEAHIPDTMDVSPDELDSTYPLTTDNTSYQGKTYYRIDESQTFDGLTYGGYSYGGYFRRHRLPNDQLLHAEAYFQHHDNEVRLNGAATSAFRMRIKETPQTGALDNFSDKMRLSLFKYATGERGGKDGGELLASVDDDFEELKEELNDIPAGGGTPLAESLVSVLRYIQQKTTVDSGYEDNTDYSDEEDDPFRVNGEQTAGCIQQNILLFTDGEPSIDDNIPSEFLKKKPSAELDVIVPNGHAYLDDVAYYAHTTNLRDSSGFDSGKNADTSANISVIYAAFGAANEDGVKLLKSAAAHGGYDKDKKAEQLDNPAWRENPPNYAQADRGEDLENFLNTMLAAGAGSRRSGTAAAVNPQTTAGEGATYQALFFPPLLEEERPEVHSGEPPAWSGQVHAFFTDRFGNLREDTSRDQRLDDNDKAVIFTDDGRAELYDVAPNGTLTKTDTVSVTDIKHLWSSSDWMNQDETGAWTTTQRRYDSTADQRYIFTFADADNDMVCDAGEQQDFAGSFVQNVDKPTSFASYLTLQEHRSGNLGNLPAESNRLALAKEQVEFIRGKEIIDTDVLGNEVRSRRFALRNGELKGKAWPLGDIIYSSPTAVTAPAENYHHLYGDKTYEEFYKKYRYRRQVVYVGSNGGMLHAFNAGFYTDTPLEPTGPRVPRFEKSRDGETKHKLGAELWAYIPHNLLPHLRWLMNERYADPITSGVHIAGVDLKPRIFDARIFEDDEDHPYGWGTVLVAGMRLGGAEIQVDVKKSGNDSDRIRTMSSAYIIMDITNPEKPPVLLGEIKMPGLGFTTCFPTVMPMSTAVRNLETGATSVNAVNNQWYLVFGSGPANADGKAHRSKLSVETSDQDAGLYVLDLKALVQDKEIVTLHNDKTFKKGSSAFYQAESKSMIAPPIAVDLDIGSSDASSAMKTDAVYFGTASGDNTDARGRMSRLFTHNTTPAQNGADGAVPSWNVTTLIDVGLPITAAPAAASDDQKRLWIYFGTGRYFNRDDIAQTKTMSLFGVKEPILEESTTPGRRPDINWTRTVQTGHLFDSTGIQVNLENCPQDINNVHKGDENCARVEKRNGGLYKDGKWSTLEEDVRKKGGWRHDFSDNQLARVTEQAAVLSGAAFFTRFAPSEDLCDIGGTSDLYGLFYRTGTPYFKAIFRDRVVNNRNVASVPLGKGQASTPSLLVDDKGNTHVLVGKDDGTLESVEAETPFNPRPHQIFWRER